jgi:pyridoxal phosphate-dependent aminotransferase EpsN
VDVYGQCADYERILAACARHGVAVVEDAAEALGATYKNRMAGSFGKAAIFSFNGNKIITTAGGGMLVSEDGELIRRARFLSSQARNAGMWYEHSEIGYNYRMSNLLAAVGRGQLKVLPQRVDARRNNFEYYRRALGNLPGLEFMPESPDGRCTRWLTCATIDPAQFGATRDDVLLALRGENIDARPVWKPMHLQPVFKESRIRGGAVASRLFETGLSLPSGSNLTEFDLERISGIVSRQCRRASSGPTRALSALD